MTAYELVKELISNAYENGYEAEVKDLTDEELAYDIWMSIDNSDYGYDLEDLEKAVKEFRK